jgi:gliding motility-associated-like protein
MGQCTGALPYIVDLSSSPNQTWLSLNIGRDADCCGDNNCVEFIITLHPDAISVSFDFAFGAAPPGQNYQINCGPLTSVGVPICLSGVGPHSLTYCKPGNDLNIFSVTSYSAPIIGPDTTLNSGCSGLIYANYFNEPSMTWTSIFPGAMGAYNSYLDNTVGTDTVNVTGDINAPAYVDYLVCGTDIAGCNPIPFCDTIRVNFIDAVIVIVSPSSQHLCFGVLNTVVTATPSGGSAPYFYSWDNGATTSSIVVGAGTYIVSVTDISGCLIATDTAIITQDILPIVANAGIDQLFCSQTVGAIALNGNIQTATGGVWSGGSGVFTPNATDLNASYTPTPLEISNDFVNLTLTTTGNNGCPADMDVIQLSFYSFSETSIFSNINVSCNGLSDGEAHVSTSGLFSPCQYSWDGGPLTTDTFALNLSAGLHQVQIVNSLGCDTLINFTISEPAVLNLILISQTNNNCNGYQNGSAEVLATGGTAPYSYSWNTIPVQNGNTAIDLIAGNDTCTVTDFNGCLTQIIVNITEPTALTLALAGVEPSCFGLSNGSISSLVGGGTAPYNYNWSTGPLSVNLYDLQSSWYSLTVTDDFGCSITDSIFLNEPTQITGTISGVSVICPGSLLTIGVTATGGTGNYQYDWTPSGQITDSISVSPISNQFYTCTISDNNGCSLLLSSSVIINIIDPIDLVATINDPIICFNDSISLTANYLGSDASVIMSWMHCPSCATNVAIYENPLISTDYVLSATNSCGQTIYDTVSVIVNSLPVIALNPSMGSICPGESVSFINNGTNSPSWNYVWNFGDGFMSTAMNPNHIYSNSGAYLVSLTVTDDNGCTNSLNNGSFVTVNPQASAIFTSSSLSETTLDPTFAFTNFSINATEYIWDFGDGQMSLVTSPIYTYADNGNFVVSLTANNIFNCPDSTFLILEVKPSYDIYLPNAFTPDGDDFNGIFYAKGYGISDKDYTLHIFNRWGDLIFESHDMNQGWDGTMKKDGTKAQDDVYTWVVYFRDISEKKHKKEGHVSLLK